MPVGAEGEAVAEAPPTKGHVPGEPALWVFLFGDMLMFGAFFCIICVLRAQHTDVFEASQATLHRHWGVVNTIVLLTSSLFVVLGVNLARDRHPRAPLCFLGAAGCGVMFAGVKAIEYTSLIHDHHTASANDFYMYYFMFTGIHLAHVAVGTGVCILASRIARPTTTMPYRMALIEGIASFWHLVDLLWIMLFATLYLMR